MQSASAGDIEITLSEGGYPIWCEILIAGKPVDRIKHTDLRDLRYAADRAMQKARMMLPDREKDEV